jgi:hypothetical protein
MAALKGKSCDLPRLETCLTPILQSKPVLLNKAKGDSALAENNTGNFKAYNGHERDPAAILKDITGIINDAVSSGS